MAEEEKITYFAETDYRNKRTPFGIKDKDRTRHVYVIGKTGMGKSNLLENMAIQDIQNGNSLAFIDPHGKTAELLLEHVPENRVKDVLYFAPFDMEYPISFNVMEDIGPDKRHLVVNGLMSTFEKIWVDAWSARMAYILQNTLLALLEYAGSTLLGINRMLADKDFRKVVVENISDPAVRSFWVDEFAKYTDRYTQEATPAIQNKVGQFTSNPLIRNIIGQPKSTFDLRKMMDEKKIIIVNLSKGRVGEGNASLLGSMIITKIYLAAMSRADVSEKNLQNLPNFYLYVDEFQSFANKSFADILSEARKYKLNLTLAHQYIEQMEEEVRAAVFGNVGTMITFRVGAYDAEVLEKEFAPMFTAEDLVNLGIYQIYLKLMIDGVSSSPFSATTIPPIQKPVLSFKDRVIENSRKVFARPRPQVEEEIRIWHQAFKALERPERSGRPGRKEVNEIKEAKEVFSDHLPQNRAALAVSGSARQFSERRPSNRFSPDRNNRNEWPKGHFENSPVFDKKEKNSSAGGAVNLETLKPKTVEKKATIDREKNVAELRQALSSFIKKDQDKGGNIAKIGNEPVKKNESSEQSVKNKNDVKMEEKIEMEEKKEEKGKSFNESARVEIPREVPEEVLRKVLSSEDEILPKKEK